VKRALCWMIGVMVAQGVSGADSADPRLRNVVYDASSVVTVYAKRGVTTHVLLDTTERIEFVATGVGSECVREEDSWCVIAPRNGTQLFVKPKSTASGGNNIAIATDRRAYSLRFVVVGDADAREPVYRLTYIYPQRPSQATPSPAPAQLPEVIPEPREADLLQLRLSQSPQLVNGEYSIAVGKRSEDIAPTMVWDDGRFTYFQFPNNRELPAVFQVNADAQESVVNARMEGDFLVADRVAREFYLRLGKAVVRVWNEAFDLDGVPPTNGTTVPGIERVMRVGVAP
jgi:type IV secretion system protein VirB9